MSSWKTTDSAPRDGTTVLLFSPDATEPQIFLGFWCEFEPIGGSGQGIEANWTDAWTHREIDTEPTHWMPLPEVPA